jgi:hypothetical protein
MSDILLKAVIEKLESLEKTTAGLKAKVDAMPVYTDQFKELNKKMVAMEEEIQSIPSRISIPELEIRSQRTTMALLIAQLKEPLKQTVKNVHYLGKTMLVCFGMVVIILGLCVWISQLYDNIHELNSRTPKQILSVPLRRNRENTTSKMPKPKVTNQTSLGLSRSAEKIQNTGNVKPSK